MWQFYKEPFNVSKPPPAPPNRDIVKGPVLGGSEAKESITRTSEYLKRLSDWECGRRRYLWPHLFDQNRMDDIVHHLSKQRFVNAAKRVEGTGGETKISIGGLVDEAKKILKEIKDGK